LQDPHLKVAALDNLTEYHIEKPMQVISFQMVFMSQGSLSILIENILLF
jgi:hypothetical protein